MILAGRIIIWIGATAAIGGLAAAIIMRLAGGA